jgi:hypothetical protein
MQAKSINVPPDSKAESHLHNLAKDYLSVFVNI